jgi:hypothetical protein
LAKPLNMTHSALFQLPVPEPVHASWLVLVGPIVVYCKLWLLTYKVTGIL